jgi:hypothetical protein
VVVLVLVRFVLVRFVLVHVRHDSSLRAGLASGQAAQHLNDADEEPAALTMGGSGNQPARLQQIEDRCALGGATARDREEVGLVAS